MFQFAPFCRNWAEFLLLMIFYLEVCTADLIFPCRSKNPVFSTKLNGWKSLSCALLLMSQSNSHLTYFLLLLGLFFLVRWWHRRGLGLRYSFRVYALLRFINICRIFDMQCPIFHWMYAFYVVVSIKGVSKKYSFLHNRSLTYCPHFT